ncbi:MAG: ATP-dependent exonuclease SbcCD, C subunit-like protein [Gammaproteobacteria bacterium]|nr:ATP-dependent exonuclease SbcCD, C subunit-like protein [Gammaproteobacteria bacterium]MBU1724392.1 ATP-dependent exonuclease SbcCD, C subunit-like protein [Gammaproteobacteria bacterium]MBU2004389.1 ATP-dependent exonuclease SbcCD, C subunit-like protein [Gammaproteobacteria bacterium]
MNDPQALSLDFASDDTHTGFRLHHLEVYNWGTFDQHVWKIAPQGHNALLTGDIGSGKSTLVDAITTLLVPTQRITYNKAAGAEGKERSLGSYVRGEYKSEKNELGQGAKAVALRDEKHYSVLLGWFYNPGFAQGMTLAQVFWLKEGSRQPERFYVTAENLLTIREHFANFGNDISQLRKRLAKLPGVAVIDTFKEYAARFRRYFGIQSEQALDLFYQTVSMKSVGNLTDFVRTHMLEDTGVEQQIHSLCRDFDNLNRLHEAVLKARRQISLLQPLDSNLADYTQLSSSIHALRAAREALGCWFAVQEMGLLTERLQNLRHDAERLGHRRTQLETSIQTLRTQEDDLHRSIEDQGGRRLRELEKEMAMLEKDRIRCQRQYDNWQTNITQLGLTADLSEDNFYHNRQRVEVLEADIQQQEQQLQTERDDHAIRFRQQNDQQQQLQADIDSLRQRKSNIPRQNLAMRQTMLEVLNLPEEDLPFAGELLQVDETERVWEGAAERVLHNFGLSLLVPERHYERVSHYVEQTHLHGRLVYYRVQTPSTSRRSELDPQSLVRKLRIKADSEFYPWLEHALHERFDYHCATDMQDFRRHHQALSQNGQVKGGGQRHEKDDRHNLHDRSRYVLGWSNRDKLQALEAQSEALIQQIQQTADLLSQVERQRQGLRQQQNALRDVQKVRDFSEIDWHTPARAIQQLREEQQRIENSSDILQSLQAQLQTSRQQRVEAERKHSEVLLEQGTLNNKITNAEDEQARATEQAALLPAPALAQHYGLLEHWRQQVLGDTAFNLRSLGKQQSDIRSAMQAHLDNDEGKNRRLSQKIVQQMQDYKRDYPADTSEVDASLEAAGEFQRMLAVLQSEDLPRHEQKFKAMLNEQTIQGIVMLQNQLEKERRAIDDKLDAINRSLQGIEYNAGTYILLLATQTQDPEIRDFRADLRQCLSHSLDDDEMYTETRFLQVKHIIDRLNGREGFSELDRKWMRKVSDVRNWYLFSASERWREDDTEREFYSDSAGKSGGQKEKLAYTVLASALAYQFGLEWGQVRSRSFRFVVIDEAFGRGSDESTRYGLELFRKLNLQLLIVTPLQKIHVIEDYINSVHFVHNEAGQKSLVRNLSIEEYRREKGVVQAERGLLI